MTIESNPAAPVDKGSFSTAPTDPASRSRALYLDLMERCLINTIYCDSPQDPWTGGVFDPTVRETGRDWPSVAHSMIGFKRMRNLRELTEDVIRNNIPGDLIETGVWRGGACIMMRAVLAAYQDSSRHVWVADSFAGLPEPDEARYSADEGDLHHTFDQLEVSREEVQANFESYGLLDDQVQFLKGWFKDTLPGAPIEQLSILRLDGDMYESTMDGLTNLYDKLSVGGYIIVDDYGAVEACEKAITDYRARHGIVEEIIDIDGIGVYWKKLSGK
jgi:O-methyltransferase